jgi:hypothetical protein
MPEGLFNYTHTKKDDATGISDIRYLISDWADHNTPPASLRREDV